MLNDLIIISNFHKSRRGSFLIGFGYSSLAPLAAIAVFELFKYFDFWQTFIHYVFILSLLQYLVSMGNGIVWADKIFADKNDSRWIKVLNINHYAGIVCATLFLNLPLLFGYIVLEENEFFQLHWFNYEGTTSLFDRYLFGISSVISGLTMGISDIFDVTVSTVRPLSITGKIIFSLYNILLATIFIASYLNIYFGAQRITNIKAYIAAKLKRSLRSVMVIVLIQILLFMATYFLKEFIPTILYQIVFYSLLTIPFLLLYALWIWWYLIYLKKFEQ
ncbi:hypothetical protein [uncultured Kriegella sp.]|uniref:hypothetical protein n=1 Tax=uncultured Kriegella sp. TaxID=1798910 RepID=UPI0030D82264|tara:strand:+ start:454927 stop:455754 length:828 start_codon:yes stop_codon:yes gene_type:complete